MGAMPKPREVVSRLLFFLLAISFILFVGFFWTAGEIQQVSEVKKPLVRKTTAKVKKAEPVKAQSQNATSRVEENGGDKGSIFALASVDKLKKKVSKKEEVLPKEFKKPTLALEKHFSAQAKRNKRVLSLNVRLASALNKGDEEEFNRLLAQVNQLLGPDNFLTLKWQGVLALKKKKFQEAEQFFRQALIRNRGDIVCRVNLIYSLLGQRKFMLAKQEYTKLIQNYPTDRRVLRLERIFEER